jgi:hypothetical protein
MCSRTAKIALVAVACTVPATLQAQFNFTVDGRQVQIHSFASQGFAYSGDNNYLTMKTSQGSFAFTDFGINASTQITDKFRVGAQLYDRNIGEFGQWHPELDWASGDYRFKDWFGVRAGKVKTTLGLYNDSQDMDFLHTFALLPQSMDPIDSRSNTIAHTGADVYGDIPIKRLGTFSYTGYAGRRPQDSTAGFILGTHPNALFLDKITGWMEGGDLRWATPVGLLAGVSFLNQLPKGDGISVKNGIAYPGGFTEDFDRTAQYFVQYTLKGLRIDGEYARNYRIYRILNINFGHKVSEYDTRSWYLAAAYRINKWFELGTYHSYYYANWGTDLSLPTNHEIDHVATARFDLNRHWNVKVEGHFIDGHPTNASAVRGFYLAVNPQGLQPQTNMLLIRTGVNF